MSIIGERLRQARKARGWSLDALAKAAGGVVSRQALYKYENGLASPRSDVLLALAKSLGVTVDYFFRPMTATVTLSEPTCRKRARLGKRKMAGIRVYAQNRVEMLRELVSFFPPERFPRIAFSFPARRTIRNADEIETLAKDIRKRLNLGLAPIENLTELLEDHGAVIISWPGEESDFDGFACWADGNTPVIVIKAGLPGDRQRSNLAHELGHLVINPSQALDAESAARRFSGAFLVPEEIVRRELGAKRHHLQLSELISLKLKYGMSIQQWIYRAKDLGIVTKAYADGRFRHFRSQGWHKNEPGASVAPETSTRIKRLAVQAIAEGVVSSARAAELAAIPLAELRQEAPC